MGLMTQSAGKISKIVASAVAAAVGTVFNYDIGNSGGITSMAPFAPKCGVDRDPIQLRTWCAAVVVVAICVYATGLALLPIRSDVNVWENMILSFIAQCFLRMLKVVKYGLSVLFSIFVFVVKIFSYFVFGFIIFIFSMLFLGYYLSMT